ncbi:hydroxymethylglutaryl-CoA lyase [Kwoniella heveanensis BCC8398]|uniref:hydroxymethylglutaryl-CoA lyase n=1 Tax=Kwoniella heveanensis BCC8398 TaxID=1296120 RepID=A0A1B9GLA2_9TREE|nr:hydroxymethylglutaryl-CoA lyase [Kwoniella heveanensis BCC8398]
MVTRPQVQAVYPSPSPDPEIAANAHSHPSQSFSDKVLQSEERLISRELKVKHGGQGRFVRIVEVSARDGLQNLHGPAVPTEVKRELVERLLDAGLRNIEVGSFVRGDWVPQMADTPKLLPTLPPLTGQNLPLPQGPPSPPSSRPESPSASSSTISSSPPLGVDFNTLRHKLDTTLLPPQAGEVHYPVLVPNMRGFDNLIKLQQEWSAKGGGPLTDEIAVFVSATEAFSQANNHAPLEKILSSLPPVINKALSLGLRVRGYVSCVITCPYSGPTEPQDVVAVAQRLLDMGCYEISLGDTTGEGDPASWARLWAATRDSGVDMSRVACHDTFSLALSSLCTLLPEGLCSIDSSLAGLGGCPYSPGATGNVPTEDVVYTLHKLGYETGVDLDKLVEAGNWLASTLGVRNESRVGRAIWARRVARERAAQQQQRAQASGAGVAGKEGTKGVLEDTEDGM